MASVFYVLINTHMTIVQDVIKIIVYLITLGAHTIPTRIYLTIASIVLPNMEVAVPLAIVLNV